MKYITNEALRKDKRYYDFTVTIMGKLSGFKINTLKNWLYDHRQMPEEKLELWNYKLKDYLNALPNNHTQRKQKRSSRISNIS